MLKITFDFLINTFKSIGNTIPLFFEALFNVHDSALKLLLDLNTKIIKNFLNYSTTIVEKLVEKVLDSGKKTSAVRLTVQLLCLYISLGFFIGISFKTFIVISIFSLDFLVNLVISLYTFIIVFTLFILTGKNKEEMKFITDFCNKSILPFITVVFLIIGLPLSDSNGFMIANLDKTINYSGIFIQVAPLLFTVLINLKFFWMNISDLNSYEQ